MKNIPLSYTTPFKFSRLRHEQLQALVSWDWNWKATIVFITIQWVTGSEQRRRRTENTDYHVKNEDELMNLKTHNENMNLKFI